jgi:hypothetical protein
MQELALVRPVGARPAPSTTVAARVIRGVSSVADSPAITVRRSSDMHHPPGVAIIRAQFPRP